MGYSDKKLGIKSWAEEDRPREKLMLHGKSTLSNAELLAILLSSGNKDESAVSLSQRILNDFNNNLHALGKANLSELQKFKGIGEAKAITISAALELGRRHKSAMPDIKPKISASIDAYNLLKDGLQDERIEIFKLILLNRNNLVVQIKELSKGGIAGTVVDPKVVFKIALDKEASSMVLAHNHPSGNLKPSNADIKITKSLVKAGEFLEIKILDHLIISEQGYFSFADEGMI